MMNWIMQAQLVTSNLKICNVPFTNTSSVKKYKSLLKGEYKEDMLEQKKWHLCRLWIHTTLIESKEDMLKQKG